MHTVGIIPRVPSIDQTLFPGLFLSIGRHSTLMFEPDHILGNTDHGAALQPHPASRRNRVHLRSMLFHSIVGLQ